MHPTKNATLYLGFFSFGTSSNVSKKDSFETGKPAISMPLNSRKPFNFFIILADLNENFRKELLGKTLFNAIPFENPKPLF